MNRLEGRVALVTGATQGLGRATIEAFAMEGAICVVNYPTSNEAPAADLLVEAIRKRGGSARAIQADVSDGNAVVGMVGNIVEAHKQLDILVNNAGVNPLLTWEEIDSATWNRTIAVNLTGVFNCCKACSNL